MRRVTAVKWPSAVLIACSIAAARNNNTEQLTSPVLAGPYQAVLEGLVHRKLGARPVQLRLIRGLLKPLR